MTYISKYLLLRKQAAPSIPLLAFYEQALQSRPTSEPHIATSLDGVYSIEKPDSIRARRVISRSKTRKTFKHGSWKMGRMIHVESPHEYNFAKLIDFDPAVKGFSEQPLIVHYRLAGEPHLHYPDFLVERTDGTKVLVEVKTRKDLQRPEIRLRTELLAKHLPAWGYEYRVVAGEWAAAVVRLDSIEWILRLGRAPVTAAHVELVRNAVSSRGKLLWGDICGEGLGKNTKHIVARMVLQGALHFDVNRPLVESSPFFAGQIEPLEWEA